MRVTVDKSGRVVLPKATRNRLNLRAGSELELEQINDKIVLKIVNIEIPLKKEGDVLVFTGKALDNLDSTLSDVRKESRAFVDAKYQRF